MRLDWTTTLQIWKHSELKVKTDVKERAIMIRYYETLSIQKWISEPRKFTSLFFLFLVFWILIGHFISARQSPTSTRNNWTDFSFLGLSPKTMAIITFHGFRPIRRARHPATWTPSTARRRSSLSIWPPVRHFQSESVGHHFSVNSKYHRSLQLPKQSTLIPTATPTTPTTTS